MLAIDDSTSSDCAREMRGTASIASAVTPRAARVGHEVGVQRRRQQRHHDLARAQQRDLGLGRRVDLQQHVGVPDGLVDDVGAGPRVGGVVEARQRTGAPLDEHGVPERADRPPRSSGSPRPSSHPVGSLWALRCARRFLSACWGWLEPIGSAPGPCARCDRDDPVARRQRRPVSRRRAGTRCARRRPRRRTRRRARPSRSRRRPAPGRSSCRGRPAPGGRAAGRRRRAGRPSRPRSRRRAAPRTPEIRRPSVAGASPVSSVGDVVGRRRVGLVGVGRVVVHHLGCRCRRRRRRLLLACSSSARSASRRSPRSWFCSSSSPSSAAQSRVGVGS